MNDKTAKLLSVGDDYSNGGNVPTQVYKYECPCGRGIVKYCRVPGFDDDYTKIECPNCKENYEIDMGRGYIWELKEK